MKKKALLICFSMLLAFVIAAALILHIPTSGEPLGLTKAIYTKIAISQVEKEIDFAAEDIVGFDGGVFSTIEIKSHESAEVIFGCIRNASYIMDLTNASLSPENIPLLVSGSCSGGFTHVYITLPLTHRLICFQFTDEDSQMLCEYVMSVAKGQVQS